MIKLKSHIRLLSIGALVLLVLLILSKQPPRQSKGLMGISALIIFIAIVIVAAIAAAVLISTGGSLQQKALITGSETREAIVSGLEVVQIRGSNPSSSGTPHSLSYLLITARLPAGSNALSLNNTILSFDSMTASQSFTYNGSVADSVLAAGTSDYVVTYIKSGPYQENDYVNHGDMIKLKFNIDGGLGENIKGRISILPRAGSVTLLEFITPDSMNEPVVGLWPIN